MEPVTVTLGTRFQKTWFLAALAFGLAVGEANLRYVQASNPGNELRNGDSTMHGFAIWSPDNSYYVPIIKNMFAGHGYTIDSENPLQRARRTPVYPLFYGLHYALFGERYSYLATRLSQSLIGALGAVLLGAATARLSRDQALGRLTTVLYALSPFTAIYWSYTITESLYPALIGVSLYAFARAADVETPRAFVAAGAALALLVLTRPVTGLLLPVVLLALVACGVRRALPGRIRSAVALALGFALLLAPWTLRNYMATGKLIVLEEYVDPQGWGEGFEAMRRWWFGWDWHPHGPDEHTKKVQRDLLSEDPGSHLARARDLVAGLPDAAFAGNDRREVEGALVDFGECLGDKLETIRQRGLLELPPGAYEAPSPRFQLVEAPPCEPAVTARFEAMRSRLIAVTPLGYFGWVPLRMLGGIVLTSFSFPFGSLNPPDGILKPWQWGVKAAFYALNAALFFSWLAAPFSRRLDCRLKVCVMLFPLGTFAYLILVFRLGIEARYALPAHPFFFLALAGAILGVRDLLPRSR